MLVSSRLIAVIPARGGSKRIPRKNIRSFRGRPLISWVIQSILASQLFDQVVVSTDDHEIAEIAIEYGAEVPFLRSKQLSNDTTGLVEVMGDAVRQLNLELTSEIMMCCVLPAAVNITAAHLRQSLTQHSQASWPQPYCATVTKFPHPIDRALTLSQDGRLIARHASSLNLRTQDLTEYWHDAGQFYWGSTSAWTTIPHLLENALGYELPNWRVHDIDTKEDWLRAEIASEIIMRLDALHQ